ncbi:hypothetical protein GCM10018781_66490 [Kitasatospora indigofera]|uniref:Uncharacterized protein n=1 Tax=Kitasatospora indigofera TaxID=67307 RepID=A0A919GDU7_9ACTN|nr:hypothetical protein GCM10018781_66490 [Kitasatospora indigofera]
MAHRIIVQEWARLVSWSRAERRWAVSHENVRSTAHRLGWTWKPPRPLASVVGEAARHQYADEPCGMAIACSSLPTATPPRAPEPNARLEGLRPDPTSASSPRASGSRSGSARGPA